MVHLKQIAIEMKKYFNPTIYFIFISLFISVPLYYLLYLFLLDILYPFISYFITIIALSISYYYFFKHEWKSKIRGDLIMVYIVFHQLATFYIVKFLNYITYLNPPLSNIFLLSILFSLILLFVDVFANSPFLLTRWIFRSFDGKGLTYEKKLESKNEFNYLVQLLIRNSFVKKIDDTIMIHDGNGRLPTYFIKYDEENKTVELQITSHKWFNFTINKNINNFGSLFSSFGFKFLGKTNINNSLFKPKHDYPIFSKSKTLATIWFFIGIFSYLWAGIISKNKLIIYNFEKVIVYLYDYINDIAKENPILIFALGIIITLFFTHFSTIKSYFDRIYDNLRDL